MPDQSTEGLVPRPHEAEVQPGIDWASAETHWHCCPNPKCRHFWAHTRVDHMSKAEYERRHHCRCCGQEQLMGWEPNPWMTVLLQTMLGAREALNAHK